MNRRRRRAATVLVIGVIALVASVVGYAYWTNTGSGSGSVAVGSTSPWQIDVQPASGSPLYPGGDGQTVGYTVTNSGDVDQRLTSVTVSVANTDGSTWTSGSCSASDFSIDSEGAGSAYVDTSLADLYGPGGSESGSVNVAMVESGGNQDGCQGVTVPLYFAAS